MIVERREKFEKLSAYANVLKRLLEISTDSISVTDLNGVITMASRKKVVNHGMESYLDIVGKTDYDLFPKEEADKTFADTMHVIRTGKTLNKIESLTLPTGIKCWYSVEKCPLQDPDGNIIGSICTSRDITELVDAKNDLIKALEKLEEMSANVMKLLETATHHLRSPLVSLAADISLIKMGLVEDSEVAFNDIFAKIQRMENLVNRYLSFSALVNKGEPVIEKLDLREAVIDRALIHFKDEMVRMKIRYDNSLGGIKSDAVVILETDLTLIDAILVNLIGNVIKYAGEGAKFAVGHQLITKDEKKFHKINVFNNGNRISHEVAEKMFQGGFSTGGSTGLGLQQSLLFAQKLGGDLYFEPNWEGYSNFILLIPVLN